MGFLLLRPAQRMPFQLARSRCRQLTLSRRARSRCHPPTLSRLAHSRCHPPTLSRLAHSRCHPPTLSRLAHSRCRPPTRFRPAHSRCRRRARFLLVRFRCHPVFRSRPPGYAYDRRCLSGQRFSLVYVTVDLAGGPRRSSNSLVNSIHHAMALRQGVHFEPG